MGNAAHQYDEDFYAWTQNQAERLRARAHNEIDWDNVGEEIESVGASQKSEIRNRMAVLIALLSKWEFQPERRGHSWQSTISGQRTHIEGKIEDSPSLHSYPAMALEKAWRSGVRKAVNETALDVRIFPAKPSYTIGQILDDQFMPGQPWTPEDLSRD